MTRTFSCSRMLGHALPCAALAILSSIAGTTSLWAVSSAVTESSAATEAADNSGTIQEIVVTAQKRSESQESVPETVTVIGADELLQSGVTRLDQLNQLAVGTNVAHFGVFLEPSIRGITTSVIGPGQENNIAVYVDGFYEPDSTAIGGDFINVESIEVLKGPQGSLYGRGATGGAILINTLGPSDHFTANTSISYGNENDVRVQGFVAGPLTDNISASVSAYFRHNDGYIHYANMANGLIVPGTDGDAAPYQDLNLRAKVKFKITDDLDVTFGYVHYRYVDAAGLAYDDYRGGDVPAGPLLDTSPNQIAPNIQPVNVVNGDEGTILARWSSGVGTLQARSFYAFERTIFDQDQDGSLVPFSYDNAEFTRATFSQAIDFSATPIDRLTLLAGLLYFHDHGINHASFFDTGAIVTSPSTYISAYTFTGGTEDNLKTESYAGYLDATYGITEKLFFGAGDRFNDDRKTYYAYLEGATVVPAYDLTTPYGPFSVPPQHASFRDNTPRATLRYQIEPSTEVYFSYTQGFKAGTFNALNAINNATLTAPVKPEKATSYEVGYKTHQDLFNLTGAIYYTTYKNLQVNTDIEVPLLGLQGALVNAAAAKNYGAEFQADVKPSQYLILHGGVAYTHARYSSFDGEETIFDSTQNSTGLRIPRAPDWTATLGADFSVPHFPIGSLDFAANLSYSSEYAPNSEIVGGPLNGGPAAPYVVPGAAGQEALTQNAYALLNLRMTWALPDRHTSITLYGDNVTDKQYKIYDTGGLQSTGLGTSVPFYYAVRSLPAMYGVKFAYQF